MDFPSHFIFKCYSKLLSSNLDVVHLNVFHQNNTDYKNCYLGNMFLLLIVSKISFEQLEQGNNMPVLGFLPCVISEDYKEEVIDINGSTL